MKILETKRLILRNLTLNDTDDLFEILSDEDTMKFYPRPYTKEETKNWINRSIAGNEKNNYGLWAVVLKNNNNFIGQCGISNQNIDGIFEIEIGYHINKNYWNNGYATEAASACLDYGFNKLNLDEIFIHTYIKNIPSIRIAQKIGMIKRNEYEKKTEKYNQTMRHVIYSLKKHEKNTNI